MKKNYMKKIVFAAIAFSFSLGFGQVGTGFEEATASTAIYVDASIVTHQLSNNAGQPMVEYVYGSNGSAELGFTTKFIATRTGDSGTEALTDGGFGGVVDRTTDIDNGNGEPVLGIGTGNYFAIEDPDGTIQVEFDQVDLTGTVSPALTLTYGLRGTGYEINDGANDRIFMALKIEGNPNLVTILDTDGDGTEGGNNATGNDIDGQIPEDSVELVNFSLVPYIGEKVSLIIESDTNSQFEDFTFDDIQFSEGAASPPLSVEVALKDKIYFNNPVYNTFTVNSALEIESITFYSVDGKQLLNSTNSSGVDISSLSSGVYIAVIAAENNQTTTVKVVKK